MSIFKDSLKETDSELFEIIQNEKKRQQNGLELIASENFTSNSVLECLGSILTNKYSEGRPGRRYYGGNEWIDVVEKLCEKRALDAFHISNQTWSVCVQPYSGSVANFAVYAGLLNAHDRIMGLDLPSGGHLTHGFTTPKKHISHTGLFFESMPYIVNKDGWIDYDELEKRVQIFQPKLLICGASAYPRDWDYKRINEIVQKQPNPPLFMCDMAHTSGLIASQILNSPFDYCDIVTSTTHKTLRGPRSGLIFMKKHFEQKIKESVFPGLQGGPHNHQIAGVATQLKQVNTPEFKEYANNVVSATKYFANALIKHGYKLMTNGSDNHLVLIDLRPNKITGSKVELVCDWIHITVNKNAVVGDKSALTPGGIRIGTQAMVSRGLKTTEDWEKVAEFFHKSVLLVSKFQEKYGKLLKDFKNAEKELDDSSSELYQLKEQVIEFSNKFDFY